MSVAHLFADPVTSCSDQQPDNIKPIEIGMAALRTVPPAAAHLKPDRLAWIGESATEKFATTLFQLWNCLPNWRLDPLRRP
jgi:hypothetical protein